MSYTAPVHECLGTCIVRSVRGSFVWRMTLIRHERIVLLQIINFSDNFYFKVEMSYNNIMYYSIIYTGAKKI